MFSFLSHRPLRPGVFNHLYSTMCIPSYPLLHYDTLAPPRAPLSCPDHPYPWVFGRNTSPGGASGPTLKIFLYLFFLSVNLSGIRYCCRPSFPSNDCPVLLTATPLQCFYWMSYRPPPYHRRQRFSGPRSPRPPPPPPEPPSPSHCSSSFPELGRRPSLAFSVFCPPECFRFENEVHLHLWLCLMP